MFYLIGLAVLGACAVNSQAENSDSISSKSYDDGFYVIAAGGENSLTSAFIDRDTGHAVQIGEIETEQHGFMWIGGDNKLFAQKKDAIQVFDNNIKNGTLELLSEISSPSSWTAIAATSDNEIVMTAHFRPGKFTARSYIENEFGPAQSFDCGWAHHVIIHPNDKWAYGACMKDEVAQFQIDKGAKKVYEPSNSRIAVEGGPRHLTFSPDGSKLYVLLQISSEVIWFDIDTKTGELSKSEKQRIATTTDGSENRSSDLHFTPDGKWLFAYNRANQEMARFSVAEDGVLTFLGVTTMKRGEVRRWAMDPEGQYISLISNTGNLSVWSIEPDTGDLNITWEIDDMPPGVWTGILPNYAIISDIVPVLSEN